MFNRVVLGLAVLGGLLLVVVSFPDAMHGGALGSIEWLLTVATTLVAFAGLSVVDELRATRHATLKHAEALEGHLTAIGRLLQAAEDRAAPGVVSRIVRPANQQPIQDGAKGGPMA